MPVGTIIAWPSEIMPQGSESGKWLICNGQSTAAYPALAVIVGEYVPDYRGFFLRGVGGGASALGLAQGDAIRNIYGSSTFAAVSNQASNSPSSINGAIGNIFIGNEPSPTSGNPSAWFAFNFDASRIVPTANENRPINKAVYYLIKASI
ncbi:phage tail protein [Anaeromusa acidaminophila]|uniref:phage tail protein n=1 Tax=Anaeromusa acidaminophila TaxID=81464 RepID=UPI0008FBD400|nr:phage tail protein [Anaeromusa acidaminophila]